MPVLWRAEPRGNGRSAQDFAGDGQPRLDLRARVAPQRARQGIARRWPAAGDVIMDRERWQQLQDLFAAARSHPPAKRERLLHSHAAARPALVDQVRALLAADESDGILDALSPRIASVAELVEVEAPSRAGPYRIVSELGRGGMGTVYLADRVEGGFEQRVAIKLIATSDADDPLHQRFVAE